MKNILNGDDLLMYVLYGKIQLFLPHSCSLKDKRQIVHSITNRIRKRFNISINEVAHQDLWQRGGLGFAASCAAYADAERIIGAINETLDDYDDVCEVIDIDWQVVTL